MQVRTNLSSGELREAARLLRSKYYWPKFFLANWYATALCLVVIGVGLHALIEDEQPNWDAMGIFMGLAAVRFYIAWHGRKESLMKSAKAMNANSGMRVLELGGIRTTRANGAASFAPWSGYNKWLEGETVFILTGSNGAVVIPVDEGTRNSLRGLLQSHIA